MTDDGWRMTDGSRDRQAAIPYSPIRHPPSAPRVRISSCAVSHAFTLGVEEEFQIVDPDTWELRSHVSELLASSAPALGDQIKRELHQSIVEVGTKICANVSELDDEICRIRRELSASAERVGLRI